MSIFDVCLCTRSRDRTGTSVTSLVFETSASTNSAIRAYSTGVQKYNIFQKNRIKNLRLSNHGSGFPMTERQSVVLNPNGYRSFRAQELLSPYKNLFGVLMVFGDHVHKVESGIE
jgi:hypothetical protein